MMREWVGVGDLYPSECNCTVWRKEVVCALARVQTVLLQQTHRAAEQ